MRIAVRPMTLPAHPDEAGAAGDEFRLAHAFNERGNTERYTEGVYVNTPAEFLASLQPSPSERMLRLHAWDGERLVGVLTVYAPLLDSTDTAEFQIELLSDLPAAQQAALAESLVARAHEQASELGRSTLIASAVGGATGPVTARTGFGGGDPTHPDTAPLVARGYALEQVYRVSVAELSALPDLEARHAAALQRSSGYELVRWTGETPPEHREAMCALHERMSIDAPVAGLAWEPEVWDDARLTEFEQSKQQAGRLFLTVAARAIGSSELAGFTTLILPTAGATARQHDTLVTKPHRGHGLGMLMKLDNLLRLRAERPELVRIVTWNAEENRAMLAVNEASGFLPVAYEAQWQWKAQQHGHAETEPHAEVQAEAEARAGAQTAASA
jgi:GNAT superfamily N-acetyltransferase